MERAVCRAWADAVGVAARIGPDYPADYASELRELGLEPKLIELPHPTMHNWVLYESNEIRQFVLWRRSGTHLEQSLRPAELPSMDGVKACHIAAMPLSIQADLLASIRDRVRVQRRVAIVSRHSVSLELQLGPSSRYL